MIGKLEIKFKPPAFYPAPDDFMVIDKLGGEASDRSKALINARLNSSAMMVWAAITKASMRK